MTVVHAERAAEACGRKAVEATTQREKMLGLEILRFFLAFAVVVYHYFYYGPQVGAMPAQPQLGHPASVLRFAVEAFFIVSGFVIIASTRQRTAMGFARARLVRLAPAIFVCSTLTFAVTNALPDALPAATLREYAGSAFTVPLLYDLGYVDASYWSLVIELRFYALVSLLLLVPRGTARLIELCLVWLVISAVIMVLSGEGVKGAARLGTLIAGQHSAFFVMGICLFRLYVAPSERRRFVMFVLTCAVLLAAQQAHLDYKRVDMFDGERSPWWVGLAISVSALAMVTTGVFAHVGRRWTPIALRLGAMSFPLYLIHQRLGSLVAYHVHQAWPKASASTGHWLATALSLIIAHVMSAWVEPALAPRLRRLLDFGG